LTTKIENHVENIANENGLVHVSSETIDVLSLSLQVRIVLFLISKVLLEKYNFQLY
jgi:hypothetical protein